MGNAEPMIQTTTHECLPCVVDVAQSVGPGSQWSFGSRLIVGPANDRIAGRWYRVSIREFLNHCARSFPGIFFADEPAPLIAQDRRDGHAISQCSILPSTASS